MGRGRPPKYPGGSMEYPGGGKTAAVSTADGRANLVVPRALAYAAELFSRARHEPSRSKTLGDLLGRSDPLKLSLKEDLEFWVEGEAADVTIGQLWDPSNAKRLTLLATRLPQLLSGAEKIFLDELHGDDQFWTAPPTDESVFPPRRRLEDINFSLVDKLWKRIAPTRVTTF